MIFHPFLGTIFGLLGNNGSFVLAASACGQGKQRLSEAHRRGGQGLSDLVEGESASDSDEPQSQSHCYCWSRGGV